MIEEKTEYLVHFKFPHDLIHTLNKQSASRVVKFAAVEDYTNKQISDLTEWLEENKSAQGEKFTLEGERLTVARLMSSPLIASLARNYPTVQKVFAPDTRLEFIEV